MTRRAGVTLAAVALGAGVFVSGAKAAPSICGSKACSEEIAAGCAGLSGAALKACKSSILAQCDAGQCTCTGQPGLPDFPVTTTTTSSTTTSTTTSSTTSSTTVSSTTTTTDHFTTTTSTTTSSTTTSSTTSTTATIPPTTTVTTSTTTTTTSALCGNGVLDPGEQCDGSNFGSFTCPSPGGALLCTSDCKIDFSECPSASSTSTTVPTTTSTTVTTNTTVTVTTATTATTTSSTTTIPTTTSTTVTTNTTVTVTTSTTTSTTASVGGAFLEFTTGTPGGTCGNTLDGSNVLIRNLTCGGLNIGGGASIVPEGLSPDGATSLFALSCTGSSCTIGPTSIAPPVNSTAPDCTDVGCNFGTPLPIPNPMIPTIGLCVLNTWGASASGTLDLTTGAAAMSVTLAFDEYLTGKLRRAV